MPHGILVFVGRKFSYFSSFHDSCFFHHGPPGPACRVAGIKCEIHSYSQPISSLPNFSLLVGFCVFSPTYTVRLSAVPPDFCALKHFGLRCIGAMPLGRFSPSLRFSSVTMLQTYFWLKLCGRSLTTLLSRAGAILLGCSDIILRCQCAAMCGVNGLVQGRRRVVGNPTPCDRIM